MGTPKLLQEDARQQQSRNAAEAAVAMWVVKPAQDWTTETVSSVLQIGELHQGQENYHINIENRQVRPLAYWLNCKIFLK